jgi:hypothetical protein
VRGDNQELSSFRASPSTPVVGDADGGALSIAEVLSKAADLLEKPGAWTKRAFARDAGGRPVEDPTEPEAVCFCAAGAIWRSGGEVCGAAYNALLEYLGDAVFVSGWNDAKDRTQAEVVAALREAARRATPTERPGATGVKPEGRNEPKSSLPSQERGE